MDIAVEELAAGITKVVLRGRFDTTGAVLVELPFNKIITERPDHGRSFGRQLPRLLRHSRSAGRRQDHQWQGGKMVILCPDNNVAKVQDRGNGCIDPGPSN